MLKMMAGSLFYILLSILLSGGFALCATADQNDKKASTSIHASPWAFGQSDDRNDQIWKKGVDSNVIFKNNPNGKMAISDGKRAAREEARKNKNHLGLSFKEESGAWKVGPGRDEPRPDEWKVRDNRHVLRAFADVEATDDLSFSVGPELILRDDTKGDESARMDQPESVFGMGMNFKYDF